MKTISLLFLVLLLASCGESIEEFNCFIGIEVQHLLTNDSNKVWVKTETRIDSEQLANGCDDSLAYIFTTYSTRVYPGNILYILFNPSSCQRDEFCEQYPMVCMAQELLCEADTTINCDSIPQNLFFAGTWEIPEQINDDDPVNEIFINFPGDTSRYGINHITSKNLELVHTEGDTEIFEKFILIE